MIPHNPNHTVTCVAIVQNTEWSQTGPLAAVPLQHAMLQPPQSHLQNSYAEGAATFPTEPPRQTKLSLFLASSQRDNNHRLISF